MTIDWNFIGTLEGAHILKGYVPNPHTSQSGVTIATGVDLGQMSIAQLNRWALDPALTAKLSPYIGLRQAAAVNFLAANPLTVTDAECTEIDTAARAEFTAQLAAAYNKASAVKFDAIPDRAQTVTASVSYQYGSLAVAAPRFWGDVTRQDWPATLAELRNFGDAYSTRRNKEADYLAPIVSGEPAPPAVTV
jgi:hypothetical protein